MKLTKTIKIKFALIMIFSLGFIYSNVKYPLLVQNILDNIATNTFNDIMSLFIKLFIAVIFIVVCSRGRALYKAKYINDIKQLYREKVLSGIFNNTADSLSSQEEAESISIFNNDINMICSDYYSTVISIIYSLITIAFSITALANINIFMTLLTVTNFVLLASVPLVFKKKLQIQKNDISETLKRFNVSLKDSIFCIPIIKSYLAEDKMKNKVFDDSVITNEANYSYTKTQENANTLSMAFGYTNDFLVVVLGVYLIYKNQMTIGSLLAVMQISNLIANPITTLSYHINTLQSILPIKEKVLEVVNRSASKSNANKDDISNIQSYKIDNISVAKDNNTILKNINLTVLQGNKYLIVGKNGSGKSTLLKLINNNILEYTGKMSINEIPVEKISKVSLYKQMAMIYQKSYLFSATIKENITMYSDYSKKHLNELSDFLNITNLVENTDINAIHRLSGGEQQKIALIRGLLRNPKVLLLDEALSAIDVNTRIEIEKYLLKQKITLLNIAHSYTADTINLYDKIIIIDNGNIIECNHYNELSDKSKEFITFE